MIYFDPINIIEMSEELIREFGGTFGLKHPSQIDYTANCISQKVCGEELYPTIEDKAAAYLFQLCTSHPFLDGNKRIAAASAHTFLLLNGHDLDATPDEFYDMVMGVAAGELGRKDVVEFFASHITSLGDPHK